MTRWIALTAISTAAAGCGGKGDDTAEPVDPAPQPGHWSTTEETITQDSCGFSEPGEAASEGFSLAIDGAVMILTYDAVEEGMPPATTCALDGWLFACDPQSFQQDHRAQGTDAVLTLTQDVSGSFASAVSLESDQALEIACEGSGCAQMASDLGWTFPCLFARRIAAQADEG